MFNRYERQGFSGGEVVPLGAQLSDGATGSPGVAGGLEPASPPRADLLERGEFQEFGKRYAILGSLPRVGASNYGDEVFEHRVRFTRRLRSGRRSSNWCSVLGARCKGWSFAGRLLVVCWCCAGGCWCCAGEATSNATSSHGPLLARFAPCFRDTQVPFSTPHPVAVSGLLLKEAEGHQGRCSRAPKETLHLNGLHGVGLLAEAPRPHAKQSMGDSLFRDTSRCSDIA